MIVVTVLTLRYLAGKRPHLNSPFNNDTTADSSARISSVSIQFSMNVIQINPFCYVDQICVWSTTTKTACLFNKATYQEFKIYAHIYFFYKQTRTVVHSCFQSFSFYNFKILFQNLSFVLRHIRTKYNVVI